MGTERENDSQSDAVRALAAVVDEHFDGDWSEALTVVAAQGTIALAALDKRDFADYFTEILHTTMTDEHWAKIAVNIGDFGDYLARSGATTDYVEHVLTRESAYDDSFDLHDD